jgi:hypothetical protein
MLLPIPFTSRLVLAITASVKVTLKFLSTSPSISQGFGATEPRRVSLEDY